MRPFQILCLLSLGFAGCTENRQESNTSIDAQPIGGALCATCVMVVAEQPAPRGQLVHRDGTRAYFCSLGDLLHYQSAPSPHGNPKAIFVEVLDPETDPLQTDSRELKWLPAGQVYYVAGLERPGIMGPPLLTYSSREQADQVARTHRVRALDWEALKHQK